ncbi:hypothetical protein PROFUN_07032 [Planoprotostelium fungivorum]|uniref:Uncharacterized protein n=1 Tax=Planoprotostelium fungivorum TaxID=1890364 RepID=A0A2P6NMX0_9EUKA|nr:hypothetical protein PROFUN_07032 [Planoprotostelium fungivorum]
MQTRAFLFLLAVVASVFAVDSYSFPYVPVSGAFIPPYITDDITYYSIVYNYASPVQFKHVCDGVPSSSLPSSVACRHLEVAALPHIFYLGAQANLTINITRLSKFESRHRISYWTSQTLCKPLRVSYTIDRPTYFQYNTSHFRSVYVNSLPISSLSNPTSFFYIATQPGNYNFTESSDKPLTIAPKAAMNARAGFYTYTREAGTMANDDGVCTTSASSGYLTLASEMSYYPCAVVNGYANSTALNPSSANSFFYLVQPPKATCLYINTSESTGRLFYSGGGVSTILLNQVYLFCQTQTVQIYGGAFTFRVARVDRFGQWGQNYTSNGLSLVAYPPSKLSLSSVTTVASNGTNVYGFYSNNIWPLPVDLTRVTYQSPAVAYGAIKVNNPTAFVQVIVGNGTFVSTLNNGLGTNAGYDDTYYTWPASDTQTGSNSIQTNTQTGSNAVQPNTQPGKPITGSAARLALGFFSMALAFFSLTLANNHHSYTPDIDGPKLQSVLNVILTQPRTVCH